MTEYEYSFNVKSLTPFFKYSDKNGFNFIEKINQSRTIYKNTNKTITRITIKEKNNISKNLLDFKDDKMSNEVLIERRETLPIEFTNIEEVESILDFLQYKKDNTLIRKRYVYSKENVKFELDDYDAPGKTFVVAVERDKTEVDKVYNEIKNLSE